MKDFLYNRIVRNFIRLITIFIVSVLLLGIILLPFAITGILYQIMGVA